MQRTILQNEQKGAARAGFIFTTLDDDFATLAFCVQAALAWHPSLAGLRIRVYCPNPPSQQHSRQVFERIEQGERIKISRARGLRGGNRSESHFSWVFAFALANRGDEPTGPAQ